MTNHAKTKPRPKRPTKETDPKGGKMLVYVDGWAAVLLAAAIAAIFYAIAHKIAPGAYVPTAFLVSAG